MCATCNKPFEELAVDPWTLPHYSLSHQLLSSPDGSKLLQRGEAKRIKRRREMRGRGDKQELQMRKGRKVHVKGD